MTAIKKIWVFIKSYWYVPLLVIVGLIVGHKNTKLEKLMDAADDSRKKQNDAIDVARIEKKEKKIKIEKEYNSAVKAASKVYELQKKNLDKNKKNKIKKIAKEYYNDKEKISQEISNEFGFTYIPPKDNSNR